MGLLRVKTDHNALIENKGEDTNKPVNLNAI
jgi:hypothetical protein